MRVSFDLDEVLFVSPMTHKIEEPFKFPLNKIFIENLRYGTKMLIPKLQELGFEVWVYTTSYRSTKYIKSYFKHYGIKFDGIVNGQRHEDEVQKGHNYPMPTKLPSFYHISLHIDDEAVVATYGKTYGFDVFQLDAQDDDWAQKIIEKAEYVREHRFE
ncbi:MAG: HAD family hydrolase [Butyrivibrio sp.]|nr:HAD family hydrolase [Butyrivibrio sp.]